MDINSVSSNKVVLNIRTPQGGEVPLNKGEVLQAQVQDVGEDGLVTIMVKGKSVEAATEVPVKPGQQLLLMVDDVRNGKTYLKVVTPELMGKIENANISANLLDMGITAKEDTILLSRKLLQYNLPVNQNNLNELNKNVKLLGGMNARNLEIAAFALSRGIGGKAALESLTQFLAPQANTAKLIPVLGSILEVFAQLPEDKLVSENRPLSGVKIQGETTTFVSPSEGEPEGNKTRLVDQNSMQAVKSEAKSGTNNVRNSTELINAGKGFDLGSKTSSLTNTADPSMLENDASQSREKVSGKAAQQYAPVNQSDGEGLNSIPKSNYPASRAVLPEQSQTNQTATPTGAADNIEEAEAYTSKTNLGSEKIMTEKSAGAGNTNPSLQIKSEGSSLDVPIQDEASAAEDKSAKSGSSGVKNDSTAKNPAPILESKLAEQMPGTQADKAITINRDQNSPSAAIVPANDESLGRLMGSEAAAIPAAVDSDPEIARDPLNRNLTNLLDTLRDLIEIDPEAPPDKIAVKLQEHISVEKEIIKALTLLKDLADSKDIVEKLPQLKEFSQRLNSLEKELAGQQLFNITSKNSIDNMASYYFSFPLPIDQGYSLCQLKINKDGRKSLRDVDQLSFVVSLNTSKLGAVLFHINWQKAGLLELQGVVENQASCNYLNKNTDNLVQSLEALGYRVNHKGVRLISSAEEIRGLKPALQEVPDRLRPLGIDVRV